MDKGTIFLQAVVNGLLLGGVYAAYSAGFSLIFGVMGVVNLAHGEFVMLGAFTSYWLFTLAHVDPYVGVPVAFALLFLLGYALQHGIINRVIALPPIMTYILTFGIHLLITNIALKVWTHDFRPITTSYSGANLVVGDIYLPVARVIAFLLALMMIGGLWLFLNRTDMGRAIRATALDRDVARLMGVNIRQVYATTFAIGAGMTGVAGAAVSPFDIISPEMGMNYTLVAFCVVVLGGMGHVPGTLWGGTLLGVIQSLAVTFLNASVSVAVTFLLLFLALLFRPTGIAGKGLTP